MSTKRIGRWTTVLSLVAASAMTLSCGGRVYELAGRVPEREIAIDGKADEWKGGLYILEEERLLVGLMNDPENLYLCLVSGDGRSSRLITQAGLTVWFDPTGEKAKTFGLKYPAGRFPGGPRKGRIMDPNDLQQGELPEAPMDDLEIVKSKKGPGERISLDELKRRGAEVKVSAAGGSFVYELRIPLRPTPEHPLAVGAGPGLRLGIGLETGDMTFSRGPEEGMEGGGMGGRGGMGGGMSGGGGMMGGPRGNRGSAERPKGLKTWLLVQLASGDRLARPSVLSSINTTR